MTRVIVTDHSSYDYPIVGTANLVWIPAMQPKELAVLRLCAVEFGP